MAYQVLARKYRPLRFSDVVGQDHVTRTLLNALAQDRIAHGYIFSGHRGIGKTTIARILASALNCRTPIGDPARPTPEPCLICDSCLEIRQGNAVDVIEIDAATNRGIDEIRELRDAARYAPARDKFKIYILDEAHQITDAAFNALLKTLEEPPAHIVFMMATTQPEDIPQTIRSRCQHFSFHAVRLDDIVGQLRLIASAEHILADDATLSLLAEAGDGSMRDALSIMDQAIASAPTVEDHPHLELSQIRELMGSVSNVVFEQILDAVHANNSADVLATAGRLLDAGNGAPQLARQFVRYLRNTIVAKITHLTPETPASSTTDKSTSATAKSSSATGKSTSATARSSSASNTPAISTAAHDLLQISAAERDRAARSAALFTEEELARFLAIMLRTFDDLGFRQEQRFHLELGLLKLVHLQRLVPIEDLLSQLGAKPTSNPSTRPAPAAPTTPQPSRSTAPNPGAPSSPAPGPERAVSARLGGAASSPAKVGASTITTPGAPFMTASSSWVGSEEPNPGAPQPALNVPKSPDSGTPGAPRPDSGPPCAPRPDSGTWDRGATNSSAAPPFESDRARKSPIAATSGATSASAATDGSLALDSRTQPASLETTPSGPHLVAPTPTQPLSSRPESSQPHREDAAERPAVFTGDETPQPIPTLDLPALQQTLAAALAAVKGQQSASEQIEDATLALDGDRLQIHTTLSKTMLPVVFSAEADRILKATLRQQPETAALKLALLPGAPAATASGSSTRKPRAAAAGSAAELAEKHPIVQQARRLFSADISNVIDLRGKD